MKTSTQQRRHVAVAEFRDELPRTTREHFQETRLLVSVLWALACHGTIVALAALFTWAFALNWQLATAFYPLAAAIVARQQRGLELLVHDGSHGAWVRWDRRLNDWATNLLAAWPIFNEVVEYWRGHRVHHAAYGTDDDPCKRRFEQMKGAFRPGEFWATMAVYTVGWYRETARRPQPLLRALAWHLCVYIGPMALLLGPVRALAVWTMFWLVPQFLFLPGLRFVAELEEHDYAAGKSEAEGTFTNVGWWHDWLFHPFQDGYHLIHHAFPSVPQWKHGRLHRHLMRSSPKYRHAQGRDKPLGATRRLIDFE